MKDKQDNSFEDYRRDRKFRRLQSSAPARPMGKNAAILRELEQAEQNEIRSERLTREVHDFFADATRIAAGIVNRISQAQEKVFEHHLTDEMREFLQDVIMRAEAFMMALRSRPVSGGQEDLETNMHNLVGSQLDGFRCEGTAQLQDKHIGQDPFDQPVPQTTDRGHAPSDSEEAPRPAETRPSQPQRTSSKGAKPARKQRSGGAAPAPAQPERPTRPQAQSAQPAQPARPSRQQAQPAMSSPQPVKTGGRAESAKAAPAAPEGAAANPAAFLASLAKDPEKMRKALELLVSTGVLKREEALEMRRTLLGE